MAYGDGVDSQGGISNAKAGGEESGDDGGEQVVYCTTDREKNFWRYKCFLTCIGLQLQMQFSLASDMIYV